MPAALARGPAVAGLLKIAPVILDSGVRPSPSAARENGRPGLDGRISTTLAISATVFPTAPVANLSNREAAVFTAVSHAHSSYGSAPLWSPSQPLQCPISWRLTISVV